ncbi:helix-turn-helix domain-containing protein [Parapedobacter koreensis]|uniref:HTH cro/C1-type domain-containing protein n=1 Tax=Parapedobacter koreensis TaxID=332977 RepID=A0A1H7U4V0_9SPHI|nr:helix-turn-helix transcriptional regulator [Parapedobacter koreensis]SEL91779.1 hypothetical protein SAMN05421740_11386 [Parapedobacter koreensis]
MKTIKKARKIGSPLISGIMDELTPVEKVQTAVKMRLAAKLDDLIKQRGWSKGDFADRVGKHPSEITKWLSGTHNFLPNFYPTSTQLFHPILPVFLFSF